MGPFKCRVVTKPGGECFAPGGECDQPAAIGLVVASVDLNNADILELQPICSGHAPEHVHEATASMSPTEWAVITLAYGASGGDLR
jgi:hypothetical protein